MRRLGGKFQDSVLIAALIYASSLAAQTTPQPEVKTAPQHQAASAGTEKAQAAVESAKPATKKTAPASRKTPAAKKTVAAKPTKQRDIYVSIPDRKLAVVEDGEVLKTFDVAVGAEVSPSPEGDFQVVNRLENPTYYHPGKVIAPGSGNPLGNRWIGLDQKGYGIHGTNEPRSIGKAASHGCIRVGRKDLEELFTMVRVGDKVHIRGERGEEIAAIFSNDENNVEMANAETATDTTQDPAGESR